MTEEMPLAGGMDPRYAPVRIGDTVHRHPGESRRSVRALLRHLETTNFDAAPRFLGVDEQGREVVSWVEGDVPLPPYPRWSMADRALADLGALLRRLHEATRSLVRGARDDAGDWASDWADPSPIGPDHVICHNDPYPENVVFRDGRVVALIDFAMAAPGRPLWDLAIAAEVWCPLGDPAHRDAGLADLDPMVRLAALAGGYDLEPERAAELVDVIIEERRQSVANIRAEVAAGNPSWTDSWAASGGDARVTADDAWIAANRGELVRAARVEG